MWHRYPLRLRFLLLIGRLFPRNHVYRECFSIRSCMYPSFHAHDSNIILNTDFLLLLDSVGLAPQGLVD